MLFSLSNDSLEGVDWRQLCHLTQVLGSCGEKKFLSGTIWAAQSQSIQLSICLR